MSSTTENSGNNDLQDSDFAAFVCDDTTQKTVAKVAIENGWSKKNVYKGGIKKAVLTLDGKTSPKYLIVDISESLDPHKDMGLLADVCKPGTVVFAIGAVNDVKLYRDLLTAGIQDYIVKPVVIDVLRDAITMSINAYDDDRQDDAPSGKHNAVGIIGVRGGVGASTIACNAAWIMSGEFRHKTALLDLDLQFGTDALAFDLEPGRGLTDALENPGRVDGLFIERAAVKYEDQLSILSAEAPLSEITLLDPLAIQHLLAELGQDFENIVIDLPRNIATSNPFILKELHDIVLVIDLSLAAARDTIRFLSFIRKQTPNANIYIVANKVETGAHNEVSASDFVSSVEEPIKWSLPLDKQASLEATKLGKTVAQSAPRSKMAIELRNMVSHFCDEPLAEEKKGFFDKLKKGGK